MNETLRRAGREARAAWPYALVLAIALGGVLLIGANLSNAFPSEARPFGWPGPSNFENGVAMVRNELVLATTIPALLLGARALRDREPATHRARDLWLTVGVDAALVLLAVLVAAGIGSWAASKTNATALAAFTTAHTLLALAFYSLAFLCGALARRHAAAIAALVWLVYNAAWENATRWILFRQVGYEKLTTGEFPTWYYVSQALSPLSLYRGILILWDRKFMDALEKAVLGGAALPDWLTPANFVVATLVVWVALPLGLATLIWWWQGRAVKATAAIAEPA